MHALLFTYLLSIALGISLVGVVKTESGTLLGSIAAVLMAKRRILELLLALLLATTLSVNIFVMEFRWELMSNLVYGRH